jgi:hypothetical protein
MWYKLLSKGPRPSCHVQNTSFVSPSWWIITDVLCWLLTNIQWSHFVREMITIKPVGDEYFWGKTSILHCMSVSHDIVPSKTLPWNSVQCGVSIFGRFVSLRGTPPKYFHCYCTLFHSNVLQWILTYNACISLLISSPNQNNFDILLALSTWSTV